MIISENKGDFALRERIDVNRAYGNLDFPGIILGHLNLQPGLNVLDIACGNSEWTIKFKKQVAAGLVAGIDQSASLIENARELARSENLYIDFRVADALQLPFDNGIFDRISCLYAIYHFPDIDRALLEMIRVSKTGGAKIVITGPSRNNNEELYAYHLQAGGKVKEIAGRDIYENSINSFVKRHNLANNYTQYENLVIFPNINAFIEYYKTTKLFLDNLKEPDRQPFLNKMRRIVDDPQARTIKLTKRIGLFEIWL